MNNNNNNNNFYNNPDNNSNNNNYIYDEFDFDFDPYRPTTTATATPNQTSPTLNINNSTSTTTTSTSKLNNNENDNKNFDVDLFTNFNISDKWLDTLILSPQQQQQPSPINNKGDNVNSLLYEDFEQLLLTSKPVSSPSSSSSSSQTNTTTVSPPQQQQQKQPQQPQSNLTNEQLRQVQLKKKRVFKKEEFKELVNQLLDSTVIHTEIQKEKQKNESTIRDLYKQLWEYYTEKHQISEYCPCGSHCTQEVTSHGSRVNLDVSHRLELLLVQNHSYNVSQVICSLYTQTLNELRVVYSIFRHADPNSLTPETAMAAKSVVEAILSVFQTNQQPLPQTIQNIVIDLTAALSAYSAIHPPAQSNLVDLDDFDFPLTTNPQQQDPNLKPSASVLSELQNFNHSLTFNFSQEFLEWGYSLLHPTFEDIFQRDWLLKLFPTSPVMQPQTPLSTQLNEQTYINVLLQLNFSTLNRLIDYSNLNLNDKLLYPLQNAIEISIIKKMPKLTLVIGKILSLFSHYFPSEIEKCLGILYKSIWPSQLLSTTLMPFVNWTEIGLTSLTNIFMDIYQLTMPIPDFYQQSDSQKYPVRFQFVFTLFKYQSIVQDVYRVDQQVAASNNNNRFPQLSVLRRLAQAASKDISALVLDGGTTYHLSRAIFDEFFFMAFVFRPPQGSLPDIASLWSFFRSELYTQLFILLQTLPHLVNRFMYCISQNLLYLDHDAFNLFIEPRVASSPLYFWDMTGDGVHWLGFMLSQRLLPVGLSESDFYGPKLHSVFQQFLVDPPSYEISTQHGQLVSSLVYKILLAINWDKVTPLAKHKIILILLGGRKHLTHGWIPYFLNHSKIMLSKDFNPAFSRCLAEYANRRIYCPEDNGLFHFILVMNSLSLAHLYAYQDEYQRAVDTFYETFPRIRSVISNHFEMGSAILCMLLYIFRNRLAFLEKDLISIYQLVTQNRNEFSPNVNTLLIFIKSWFTQNLDPDTYSKYLNSWIYLLKTNIWAEENITILNYLASGSYFKSNGDDMVQMLLDCDEGFKIKYLQKVATRRPWISYLLSRAYVQRTNSNAPPLDYTNVAKSSLLFMRDMALLFKAEPLSLLFWEQFWILHFDLLICYKINPLSKELEHSISKTFSSYISNEGHIPILPAVKKIYISFSTFNRNCIFTNQDSSLIVYPQNQEIYGLLNKSSLWIFTNQGDRTLYEANQRKWLNSYCSIIDPSLLVSQLLCSTSNQQSAIDCSVNEFKKFRNFEEYVNQTAKWLSAAASSESATNFNNCKLFSDLKSNMGLTRNLAKSILEEDKEFLDLSQNLSTNQTSKLNVIVKCSYPSCIGLSVMVDNMHTVVNQKVSDQIQQNRKRFNDDFYSLFEKMYHIAMLSSVIEDYSFIDLFSQNKEDLFAFLVQLTSEYKDSVNQSILPFIQEVAYKVGKEIIDQDPANQNFLIDLFLKVGTGNSNKQQSIYHIDPEKRDYTLFIRLFKPSTLSNMRLYLEYLEKVISFRFFSSIDLRSIINSFKLENNIDNIISTNNGKEFLFNLLPSFIRSSVLIDPSTLIISSLLKNDINYIYNINAMLVTNNASNEICDMVFGKTSVFINLLRSTLETRNQQIEILHTLINRLSVPVQNDNERSATPIFVLKNILSYEFIDFPLEIRPLLIGIRSILISSLRPIPIKATFPVEYKSLTLSELRHSITLLNTLMTKLPIAVNMLWELFYHAYTFLLDKVEISERQKYLDVFCNELLGNLAVEGVFSQATFHLQILETAEQMNNIIVSPYYNVVNILFSVLNWSLVFEQDKIPDHVALQYLKLAMYISIINGTHITSPEFGLRLATEGDLNWFKCGRLDDASLIFDGTAITKILTSTAIKRDPTAAVLECLTLLKDITLFLDNYSMAISFMLEARSLLYFSIQDLNGTYYWQLKAEDQAHLLQGLMLPMIRSLAENRVAKDSEQSGTQQRLKTILKIMLSSLTSSFDEPVQSNISYATSTVSPKTTNNTMSLKAQTFVHQFLASCSVNLCLQILSCAHLSISDADYCLVIENTLRSFLSNENENISALINKYLVLPMNSDDLIQNCITNNCHLTLYIVVLQKVRTNSLDHIQFLDNIITISHKQNHQHEIWLIWFLIIRLVCNGTFNLKNKTVFQKIDKVKGWISEFFGGTANTISSFFKNNKPKNISPHSHLASRACFLYLQRSIIQKGEKLKEGENLLVKTSDSLHELASKKSDLYGPFQKFFEQSENFLSPILEYDDFAQIIITTLVPFANYMSNIIKYDS
eukprot:gene5535-6894_t